MTWRRWSASGSLPSRSAKPVLGLAKPYPGEDLVDHDDLRRDPALGAALGRLEARRPGLASLGGKSTLNRLEKAPAGPDRFRRIGHDAAAVEALFVDLFLDAHANPSFTTPTSCRQRERGGPQGPRRAQTDRGVPGRSRMCS